MIAALVIAPPPDRERVVTGLRLGERGRRVAIRAGVPAERVRVVRCAAELRDAAAALAGTPLLLVRADGWVVAAPLVEPLRLTEPGARAAVDAAGEYAGALRVDAGEAAALVAALADDLEGGDRAIAARAERVEVGRRARHPARTDAERRAADAWQFELVNKPLDAFLTVRFYRPVARPLTRLFLRSPFTPNMISLLSAALSIGGCVIAAGPTWGEHVIGMAILVLGGIVDANDGEVARLRLEGSKLGAWLDAIGDDLARLALMVAVGLHVAGRHPDLPVMWTMGGALALTLAAMLLIYWYCIFVIRSTNNQDYTAVLGVGPGVGETGRRSIGRWLGDLGTQIARRDFIDLAALGLALASVPEATYVGLVAGAVIGLGVVLPAHLKIVRSRRAAHAPQLTSS